ncbi:transmembrane protein 242 isoform X2 [Apis laboriosa]|uniref:transmembrane protein 242 n=1 Tax=Apis dorsata TaxID=7462 RepID=UPI0003DF6BF3|nr:transmembrane protein 242 [Apis dorsata]XP_043791926.1 transmembrane protein 242 isoform X2 [Apis laboriosa]
MSEVNRKPDTKKRKEMLYETLFLTGIAGISAMIGFFNALASVKKQDSKHFDIGFMGGKGLQESGAALATRALLWGSAWAVSGCSILFYGIWKLSGATNAKEFRLKAGNILPKIPKNDPPQSRTEFENLTDLLKYVSEEWGKEK